MLTLVINACRRGRSAANALRVDLNVGTNFIIFSCASMSSGVYLVGLRTRACSHVSLPFGHVVSSVICLTHCFCSRLCLIFDDVYVFMLLFYSLIFFCSSSASILSKASSSYFLLPQFALSA